MAEKEVERTFTVPLRKVFEKPRSKRAPKAVNFLRRFMKKHFRTEEKNIKLSNMVNENLWDRGITGIPRKIEVKVIFVDGIVNVFLKDEKIVKKKEEKKEEKKGKKEEKKEEVKGDGSTPEASREKEEKQKEKKEKEKAIEKAQFKKGGK